MFSGVTVALPTMGAELRAGATELGLVETLFLAGSLALMLPMGRLADAGDKRSLYKLGLLGFGVSSILLGLLSWTPAILLLRALQGVLSAMFATTGPAILAEIVPPERRGRAFGSSIGAAYLGLTLGPIGAGFLVDLWGWRLVFLFGGGLLVAGAILIHALMGSSWRPLTGAVHGPSAAWWALAVSLAVAGSATLGEGLVGYLCLSGAALVGLLFVAVQLRASRPLVDLRMLRGQPVLSRALLVQMLLYMNAFASVFLISVFMQVTLGHSARTAGQVIAAGTVLMAIVAPLSGVLSDRYPPRWVSSAGVACVLATTVLASRLDATSSLVAVTVVLSVQGLGFALFSTPNMKVIMGAVPPEQTGMASALGATSRSIGMVGGMLVTGLLISLGIGHDPITAHPQMFLATMLRAYLVFSVAVGFALVVSLLGRDPRPAVTGT